MFKRIISATIVLAIIGTTGTVSYTSSGKISSNEKIAKKINSSKIHKFYESNIEVFQPKDNLVTSHKTVLLSGKAPEESKVVVEVYSTPNLSLKNLTKNNIALNNDKALKEFYDKQQEFFLPPSTKEIEVGSFGIFVQELELKLGLNKINVYIKGSEDMGKVRFIYVNEETNAEDLINDIDRINFLKVFKKFFLESNKINEEDTENVEDKEDIENVEPEDVEPENIESIKEETKNIEEKESSIDTNQDTFQND
ncbi:hypothetical protein [Sporosalibacterium faouarense]|uniref:hypothetical protein n=1 Tax=Sporosalibacterium faouarense TaxID=516123 RepID=UPI00192BC215|nr:hypothetical protein [Sporosalibacterium faouarense]